VVIGVVVGASLGIVLGRFLWNLLAREIKIVPPPSVPPFTVALMALGAPLSRSGFLCQSSSESLVIDLCSVPGLVISVPPTSDVARSCTRWSVAHLDKPTADTADRLFIFGCLHSWPSQGKSLWVAA
jgi:hypothetical protein